MLSFIPSLLLFIVFIGFALGKGIDAVKEEGIPRNLRWRKALAIPLMVGGFWTLDAVTGLTSRTSAQAFVFANRDTMVAAERKAGPGRPVAMRYMEGVPDGGVAIIRSDLDPTMLVKSVQLRLVGEDINRCRPLMRRDWLCCHD